MDKTFSAASAEALGWQPDTGGHLLTLSAAFLSRLLASTPELAGLCDLPGHIAVPPGGADAKAIGHMLDRIGRELAWSAPARDRALESLPHHSPAGCLAPACLGHTAAQPKPRAGARLAARFAATVEAGFRRRSRMSAYADALGAEPAALRAATRALTGRSPSGLLRDRPRLEAKRLLLYSNISVAEAAYALGFEDPAYVSRVFRKATGQSPRAYRQGRQQFF